MLSGQPSSTADFVAYARALHQKVDEPPIFTDPLATRIWGGSVSSSAEFDQRQSDDLVRARRLFIAARSRVSDDTVADAIERGCDQVVILGAGLDTTAYRQSSTHVRFYEVDNPATQEYKRSRLAHAGITIPPSLTFVPVDFEQETLAGALAQAGLDRTRGTVFVWLGVAVYLTRPAVDNVLRYIASGPAELVFDYFYPLDSTPGDPTSIQLQHRAELVAAAGEPWRTFFTAEEIRAILLSFGYRHIEDRSASELLATYGWQPSTRSTDSGPHLIHACTA
ncbi:class I SAM-dependent methyltransferase [Nocardia abscessus]|uniref:class I SAM-dependent methyltransferase n=1 Tax=Nocardia abscessus TaxID=120957 RepID=UPI002457E622|nr:class I SAM-dependent methyltransferase [Nocardia abscessus]